MIICSQQRQFSAIRHLTSIERTGMDGPCYSTADSLKKKNSMYKDVKETEVFLQKYKKF